MPKERSRDKSRGFKEYTDVRKFYGRIASEKGSCCCLPETNSGCCRGSLEPSTLEGPALGCGDPLVRIKLEPGMDVLDIGCGAGFEVLKAAALVAPSGVVYGLDITDEMLTLALENRRRAGIYNAVFLRGSMEEIPLPQASVDVIISNCVINLSRNKPAVFSEMFRVLKPSGCIALTDTVMEGEVPEWAKKDAKLWCSCVSGALSVNEYEEMLRNAGFTNVFVDVEEWYKDSGGLGQNVRLGSAFISAKKPR